MIAGISQGRLIVSTKAGIAYGMIATVRLRRASGGTILQANDTRLQLSLASNGLAGSA